MNGQPTSDPQTYDPVDGESDTAEVPPFNNTWTILMLALWYLPVGMAFVLRRGVENEVQSKYANS